MLKKIKVIIFVVVTIGLSVSLQSLVAAWVSPTAMAPMNNVDAPISIGSMNQSKRGSLILNTDGNQNGLVVPFGNVGIGSIFPNTKLDVDGEIRMGSTGLGCTASSSGAIRYNSTIKASQFCDGLRWKTLATDLDRDGIVDWNDWDDNDANKKHPNLIPANIASGTSIFGVVGTMSTTSCPVGWIASAGYCVSPEFPQMTKTAASAYCSNLSASLPSIDTYYKLEPFFSGGSQLWTSSAWAGTYDAYGYVVYWYMYQFDVGIIGGGGAWTNGIPSSNGVNHYFRCIK